MFSGAQSQGLGKRLTYSLHCSSFFWGGVSYRILHIKLVKPKKGTTMETIGGALKVYGSLPA